MLFDCWKFCTRYKLLKCISEFNCREYQYKFSYVRSKFENFFTIRDLSKHKLVFPNVQYYRAIGIITTQEVNMATHIRQIFGSSKASDDDELTLLVLDRVY